MRDRLGLHLLRRGSLTIDQRHQRRLLCGSILLRRGHLDKHHHISRGHGVPIMRDILWPHLLRRRAVAGITSSYQRVLCRLDINHDDNFHHINHIYCNFVEQHDAIDPRVPISWRCLFGAHRDCGDSRGCVGILPYATQHHGPYEVSHRPDSSNEALFANQSPL